MFIIKYKKVFIGISLALVALALAAMMIYGLRLGIDFKGGSALEFTYAGERPTAEVLKHELENVGFRDASVQPIGETGIVVKTRNITEAERQNLADTLTLQGTYPGAQESFTAIGPSVGAELKHKAILSIVLVLLAIIFFVAYAFRKVSSQVSSWKYGFAVIIALIHDIIIPTGVFALFGHFYGAEVDTLFVVALLTTLALSVSDTIVVFDRVRENLVHSKGTSFEMVVGESLSQTFVRSINTSFVVLIMVVTLAIVGPESTKLFATILAIGMFIGTYSSIFLASPLLVLMEKIQKKEQAQ
jgi:preprotein translocase subunit SecF